MARSKNKNRTNANNAGNRGGGRGGRGGRGGGDNRQPTGTPGVVRRAEKPKRAQARGGRQSKGRKGGAGPLPVEVATQVREDGMFRHQEVVRAHTDAVMSIVMAADCIYTASRDKTLKRWKVGRAASGGFELVQELEVPLGEVCWCLISAGEWLFCGLGDGTIKGFMKSGQDTVMKGHTKRVGALLQHQHVLLSGSADGTVGCWQMDAATQKFSRTHSISEGISGSVTAMSILNEKLWVGGTSGVAVVDLTSLSVVGQLEPKKSVAGMIQFEGHMIVVYSDGSACIFDANGIHKMTQQPLPAGPVLCVAGLESGPRVLCGHAKGQVSSITLPMFQLKIHWHVLERCKVQVVACAGHDGIYVLGSENGNLQLWQRDGSVDL